MREWVKRLMNLPDKVWIIICLIILIILLVVTQQYPPLSIFGKITEDGFEVSIDDPGFLEFLALMVISTVALYYFYTKLKIAKLKYSKEEKED